MQATTFADAVTASANVDASRIETLRDFEEALECPMTDEDVIATSDDAAAISQQITEAEISLENETERHKEAKKRLDLIIVAHRRALAELMRTIKRRSHRKLVVCREEKVFATGVIRTIRLDTGEVTEERPMTERERQADLFPEVHGDQPEEGRDADAPESYSDLSNDEAPPTCPVCGGPCGPDELTVGPCGDTWHKDDEVCSFGAFCKAVAGQTIDDPRAVLGTESEEKPAKKRRGRK